MTSLDPDTPDTVRISAGEARNLAITALAATDLVRSDREIVADHLVDAALCGYGYAGLPRIPALARAPELVQPRSPLSIGRETPVSASVDGGNTVGYVAAREAADIAIRKAESAGLALVGLYNSWNSGRAAYYAERVARAGLIVIHTTATPALVVPPGATIRALGTNPIAVGFPHSPDPVVVDLGTGAAAWAEVSARAGAGGSFDTEVGVDGAGDPTRLASAILDGGLSPFGGHKGFALSLAIQALGLAAGSTRRRGDAVDFGYVFVAFRPDLLVDPGEFAAGLSALTDRLRSLPVRSGGEVRIPSERAFREREIRREQGIVISHDLHRELMEMSDAGKPL